MQLLLLLLLFFFFLFSIQNFNYYLWNWMYSIAKWSVYWSLILVSDVIVAIYVFSFSSLWLYFVFILVLELFKMAKTSVITTTMRFTVYNLVFRSDCQSADFHSVFVVVKYILIGIRHCDAVSVYKIALNWLEKKNISFGTDKHKTFFNFFFFYCCLLIYIRYFDKTLYFHWSSWLKNEKHFKWYRNSFI